MNRSLLSAFDDRNRGMLAPVRSRLAALLAAPQKHARFLNMLSLLEHIGSRKIMMCRATAAAGQEMLKHLAEETRHAHFFKRAADKTAQRALDYSPADTMAAYPARCYMDRLDAEIALSLGTGPLALPYLYMSLIVEFRAVWFYHLYQGLLADQRSPISLNSVLAEEELHLAAMLARLSAMDRDAAARIDLFSGFEEVRFLVLWSAIENECDAPHLAGE